MVFTRTLRSFIGRLMAGALLLSQLAIAAYACPLPASATAPSLSLSHEVHEVHVADSRSLATCDEMDATQKSLCAEHCHPSSKSTDTASPPTPVAASAIVLYAVPADVLTDLHAAAAFRQAPNAPSLDVADSPPHAVVHCVWRI